MNTLLKAADLLRRCCKDGRYDPAIRVLEAAAKVDKADAIYEFESLVESVEVGISESEADIENTIRALLAALPDEAKP
jgi:hypothetical protein